MTFSQIKETTLYLVLALGLGAVASATANLFIQGEVIFALLGNFMARLISPELAENVHWMQGIALFIARGTST